MDNPPINLKEIPGLATRRDPPKTVEQCAQIAMAEFLYWRDQDAADLAPELSMGAIAAAANIYAAISSGIMAPWHPK